MLSINKKITLEFLGEEYADSYVNMSAIPLKDYDEMVKQSEAVKDDNKKAMEYMVKLVQDRFQSGSIKQGDDMVDMSKEDISDMPGEFFLNVIRKLSGQDPNA